MYKVKQLYVVYDDGDGHKHLIPKESYRSFEKALERCEESYAEHGDEDIVSEEINDLLDHFSDRQLEGDMHYVVLEEHVITCDKEK